MISAPVLNLVQESIETIMIGCSTNYINIIVITNHNELKKTDIKHLIRSNILREEDSEIQYYLINHQ
jgi:hypothetical protein